MLDYYEPRGEAIPDKMLRGHKLNLHYVHVSDHGGEAHKKGEKGGKAVPYDIQETDDKKVTLVLDKSDFEIVILNQMNIALKAEFN